MLVGGPLFLNADLDSYLRAQVAAIDEHVRTHVSTLHLEKTDIEIAEGLLPGACVAPLIVDFDHPQKDVREARTQINDAFHGRISIDGVRATRTFAFTGDSHLFHARTNPWSTTVPHGEIRGGSITIGVEGRNDPDTLRGELDRQEHLLRDCIENSRKQIERHNNDLKSLLTDAIARRRKTLEDIESLRNKI